MDATDRNDDALEFTGERFTPECVREIVYEHWHRYAWARGLVAGKRVLDCACGEGYGSHLLAGAARAVTGVDVDRNAVEHARKRYAADNLDFVEADALDLPFDDDRFDVVVSFETLEHLAEHDELLSGFRRVLKPDGILLLSSPDKRTYSDLTGYDNEFHVRELYRDELDALLTRHFPNYSLFGQKLMFHSLTWAMNPGDGQDNDHDHDYDHDYDHNDDHENGYENDRRDDQSPAARVPEHLTADDEGVRAGPRPHADPLYFLAVAAADGVELPVPPSLSLFTDADESVYAHYNDEVAKHIRAGHLLAEREQDIERLKQQIRRLESSTQPGSDAPTTPWTRLRRWLKRR